MTRAKKHVRASNTRQGIIPRKTFTKPARSAVSLHTASCQLALKWQRPSGITWPTDPKEMNGEARLKHGKTQIQSHISSYHQSMSRGDQMSPFHHLTGISKDPPNIILQSLVPAFQRGPSRDKCTFSWRRWLVAWGEPGIGLELSVSQVLLQCAPVTSTERSKLPQLGMAFSYHYPG